MANEQNLLKGKATQFKSGEEAAKAGSKGGIASGKAKRRKKLLRECLTELLDREYMSESGKSMTGAELVSVKLFMRARDGDIKAFEVLRDTVGEKPQAQIEVATADQAKFNELLEQLEAGE